jgi:hypothetical protein
MPYRHAWLYLAALLAATFVAFWPSYFSKLPETSWEFHAHGITAGLWIVMLLAQSWTVHRGGMGAHRLVGRSSLLLFPAFIAGSVLLSIGFAERYVGRVSEFHIHYAPRLALSDLVSIVGVAWFYFHALKWRRKVHLHARYMLVTPIFLLGPIFGRIFTAYGPLAIGSDAELYRFGESLRLVALATVIGLFLLYRSEPKHGRPYLEAAGFVGLQAVLMETLGLWGPWAQFYANLAHAPVALLTLASVAVAAVIAYLGWRAGIRPPPSRPPVAAAHGC